ncbi:MAG: Gfo/Idh/MocA family oxidoreductase [Armatimonadetes bacterium]|nr:Gfo/Idh/MocA family oxidoreductase [Armatimonadota bacterium]
MAKVRVGIVGLGWAASGHVRAFQANPDVEIVAACTSKSADEAREFCGCDVAVYPDYDDFLAHDGLDVVDICTPHPLHAPQAIKAAEAGKHLMIEKPLALDYDSLLAMRDAIRKAGVKSTVYFELRFIPHFHLVKSAIARGLLGDVHYLEVDYYHGIGPWYAQYQWNVKKEIGGSALLTAGIHALDALLYFADREVAEVSAFSTRSTASDLKEYEYDTTSVALLRFADGTCGKCVSCIDCRQPYLFNIHLIGSQGTLWNDQLSTTQIDGVLHDEWISVPTQRAESGDTLDHPYPPQVDHFVQCLQEDRDSSINFEEAFKTHRVAFAIEKSLAEGRPVRLEELPA